MYSKCRNIPFHLFLKKIELGNIIIDYVKMSKHYFFKVSIMMFLSSVLLYPSEKLSINGDSSHTLSSTDSLSSVKNKITISLTMEKFQYLRDLPNSTKNRQKIIRTILKLNRDYNGDYYYYYLLKKLVDAGSKTGIKLAKKLSHDTYEEGFCLENKLLLLSSLIKNNIISDEFLKIAFLNTSSKNTWVKCSANSILVDLAERNQYIEDIKSYLRLIFINWKWEDDTFVQLRYIELLNSIVKYDALFKKELLDNVSIPNYVKTKIKNGNLFNW